MQTAHLWAGTTGIEAAIKVERLLLRTGWSLIIGSILSAATTLLLSGGQSQWMWGALLILAYTLAGALLVATAKLTRRSLRLRFGGKHCPPSIAVEQDLALAA